MRAVCINKWRACDKALFDGAVIAYPYIAVIRENDLSFGQSDSETYI